MFFFLNSCVSLPGINKAPEKKEPNRKITKNEYSINDVGINIISINNLSEQDINFYNNNKIEEADYKVKKFSNIYNCEY